MDAAQHDQAVSRIAAAIGEPARARILYCLLDGHARTSTELAVVAEVTPSTASVHLGRLKSEKLVDVFVQGKHRYYSLTGPDVARALEALSTIAGRTAVTFVPTTPSRLVLARTCYDHMAGKVAVQLHDHLRKTGWLTPKRSADLRSAVAGSLIRRRNRRPTGGQPTADQRSALHSLDYALTAAGTEALEGFGVDVEAAASARRRFAYACLDWSERQPHLAGALGAALLETLLKKRWVEQDLDSRALSVTELGQRELRRRFGALA